VTETSGLAQPPERRSVGLAGVGWLPATTGAWVALSFFIGLALAAVALTVFGAGSRGTYVGLRVTALWSFLQFWPAYAGSATAALFGPRFAGLARRGRDFGLSFAAALAVHIGLVLWLYRIATEDVGVMAFFWVGVLCTCLLTLFSLPQLRAALGPRLWWLFCTAALEYIALAFAKDFIFIPLGGGFDKYPLTSLPFAVTLVAGTGLRLAAFLRRMTERRA
jgi:hypothetical protein